MTVLSVFLLILSLGLLFWQSSNLLSAFFGSPYVMANKKTIIDILKFAGLKKNEVLYDLGCGNGQILIEAARMRARAVGLEISPLYFFWAKIRTQKYRRISVRWENVKNADLSGADVIYCYLLPEFLAKIGLQLVKKIKKGSRLVSVGFPVKGLKLSRQAKIGNHQVFIYLSSRSN